MKWNNLSHTEIYQEIGKRIKEMRKSFGYTQLQLSEAIGISVRTITYIEQGEKISFDSIIRIYREFNQLDRLEQFLYIPPKNPLA